MDIEWICSRFNKDGLERYAKLVKLNQIPKDKRQIAKLLIETKKEKLSDFYTYNEMLRGCGRTRIINEIYALSNEVGRKLETYKKLTLPLIVLELLENGLENRIDQIAVLTKVTRSKSYSPKIIVGSLRNDLNDLSKLTREIETKIKEINSKNHNKIGLKNYVLDQVANKVIITYHIEIGKRIISQLPLRGKEKLEVYPTSLKIVEVDLSKNEVLTNIKDDSDILNETISLISSNGKLSGKVKFIQPESQKQLNDIIQKRIVERKNHLSDKGDSASLRELDILNGISNLKRTKLILKNVAMKGKIQVFQINAEDADESLEALNLSQEDVNSLIKKSSEYTFGIKYKDATIEISPGQIRIISGRNSVSDFEFNVLKRLLREKYDS